MTLMRAEDYRQFSRPREQLFSGVGVLSETTRMSVNALSSQMGLPRQTFQRQMRPHIQRLDLNGMARHLWFFRRYFGKALTPGNLAVLVQDGRVDLGERLIIDLLRQAPPLEREDPTPVGRQMLRFRFMDWVNESGRSVMEICLLAGLPYATGMRAAHHPVMDRIEANTLERSAAAFATVFRRPFTMDDLIEYP